MEIRNVNFSDEIIKLLKEQGKGAVLAVIDEHETDLKKVYFSDKALTDVGAQAARWKLVTQVQLKILAAAIEQSSCLICEITYAGASVEQISAILSKATAGRHHHFSKKEPNALLDENIRGFVKKAPDHWVVMGYHTNACVMQTCGVGPISSLAGQGGLLQYGKKVYTADSVLHPEAPGPLWDDVLKPDCKNLLFYRDIVMSPPPPPPLDDDD